MRADSCVTADEARAEPVWNSHRFTISDHVRRHVETWRIDLQLNSIKDFYYPDGSLYDDDEIENGYIRQVFRSAEDEAARAAARFVRGARKRPQLVEPRPASPRTV